MSETEGEMWARLGRAGTVLDWANGPTIIDFNGKVSIVSPWYTGKESLVPEPEPGEWKIMSGPPPVLQLNEAAARAAERALCVKALRVEAREYREYADRTRDDGTYMLSSKWRAQYLNTADAYERAALLLEHRHV